MRRVLPDIPGRARLALHGVLERRSPRSPAVHRDICDQGAESTTLVGAVPVVDASGVPRSTATSVTNGGGTPSGSLAPICTSGPATFTAPVGRVWLRPLQAQAHCAQHVVDGVAQTALGGLGQEPGGLVGGGLFRRSTLGRSLLGRGLGGRVHRSFLRGGL